MAKNGHEFVEKVRHALRLDKLPRTIRRVVVVIVGGVIFAAGVVMIVTPGPAFVLIPAGLLILATEFKWAERMADRLFQWGKDVKAWWKRRRAKATR